MFSGCYSLLCRSYAGQRVKDHNNCEYESRGSMTTIFRNIPPRLMVCTVRTLLVGLAIVLILGRCSDIFAQQQENYDVASNSKQAYQQALKRIPWKQLSTESHAKAKSVVTDYTIFRRLPQQAVYCDPAMYEYCLSHPETVVGIWEHLGVTQVSVSNNGDNTYTMKESTGTVAEIEVIYRSQNLCILYAKGTYLGPMIQKSIKGDVLLIMQSRFGTDKNAEPFLVARMDAFVRIHNPGAELIAKLLTPVVGKIVDNNFEQTVAFIGNLSDASQTTPQKVIDIGKNLKGVRPEAQAKFLQTVRDVYASAQEVVKIQEISARYAQMSMQPEPVVMQKTFEPRTAAAGYSGETAKSNRGESVANPAYSYPQAPEPPITYH